MTEFQKNTCILQLIMLIYYPILKINQKKKRGF